VSNASAYRLAAEIAEPPSYCMVGPRLCENAEANDAVRNRFPERGNRERRQMQEFLVLFVASGLDQSLCSSSPAYEVRFGMIEEKDSTNF